MMLPFMQGFGTGGGLIVAIGAQNAFVLSQGVRKNHPLIIALTCIVCDAVFITAGIAGFGTAVASNPLLSQWVAWGGAAFLFFYGAGSLRSAITGGSLDADGQAALSVKAAVTTTLAVTLLNPHFYLDTVVLLGGISSRFQGQNRMSFWAGSIAASILWFLSLSFGARLLAPLFRQQIAWRILDSLVCLTMWGIAASLV
ncbi:LysE1 [Desulforapulum autotrophicum HRM2]|uniref:LysE1 n=1 Tax=Desulforapulum autotrophicum (strain ATCC 43914 / DSM 3382 / VKM B-1955 / HRM2) TaxID=177437 RepID=C0QKM1_DESAH|nr:LysE/ArgO family amino acid transporter [Desulforapulum autotrophicum]ACN14092.1 LysE1 [Desulforapulum autotrophicum HRM2]